MTYSEFMMLCMALAEEHPEILDYPLVFRIDREDLSVFEKSFEEGEDANSIAFVPSMVLNTSMNLVCIRPHGVKEGFSKPSATLH